MKKPSLKQQAYSIIKDKIISCTYLPGFFLTEDSLCEELNVSRTPIREALIRLEQERLVQVLPKKGIIVSNLTIEDINTTYEIRNLVEPYCLDNFGYRIDRLALQRLRERIFAWNPQIEQPLFYKDDDILHKMIYTASNNPYLCYTMDHIYEQNCRLRILSCNTITDRMQQSRQEHLNIIDSILAEEYGNAVSALRMHLDRSKSASFSLLLSNGNHNLGFSVEEKS